MHSIGWIIFWKCVVVSVWAAFAARWAAYRARRKAQGLPMRYSKKRRAYVVSDWTETVDRGAGLARNWIFGLVFFWWTILALVLVTGREAMLAGLIQRVLS